MDVSESAKNPLKEFVSCKWKVQTNEKLEMNPLSFLARCVHLENRWPSSRVYQASNIRVYKKHVDLQ